MSKCEAVLRIISNVKFMSFEFHNYYLQEKALTWLSTQRQMLEPQLQRLEIDLAALKSEAAAKSQYMPHSEKVSVNV